MRITNIKLTNFRRFHDLEIKDLPATAKLVVLAGPNGSGKSSLFDAFLIRYRRDAQLGWNRDDKYYNRPDVPVMEDPASGVSVRTRRGQKLSKGAMYVRTAYRHDPEFATSSLSQQSPILESLHLNRLIEPDATVAINYARLASQAMEDVFVNEAPTTTMESYRNKIIGEIREPLKRLFPDLTLAGFGNPLDQGSFQFNKGETKHFDYKNLSGGERAAFDLILDMIVKRKSHTDAIYCIDEPETHLNTKVQGALLQELLNLVPEESQLWIASHSIGMMRKARELYDADPSSVVFLDFGGHNFDKTTVITPQKPTREFWRSVLHIALDDLANLIAPREVVICEGSPDKPDSPGKKVEHDARVYSTIFADEFPDVGFISAGSSNEVSGDFLALATALPKVAAGMKVRRLIDRDDHAQEDVECYRKKRITVLGRRHLESYLFDDEVLISLCNSKGRDDAVPEVLAAKKKAIEESVGRGNPSDDIKSATGEIYNETKRILDLRQGGNDKNSFAQNTLAPLIKPGMAIYTQLKNDIFGS